MPFSRVGHPARVRHEVQTAPSAAAASLGATGGGVDRRGRGRARARTGGEGGLGNGKVGRVEAWKRKSGTDIGQSERPTPPPRVPTPSFWAGVGPPAVGTNIEWRNENTDIQSIVPRYTVGIADRKIRTAASQQWEGRLRAIYRRSRASRVTGSCRLESPPGLSLHPSIAQAVRRSTEIALTSKIASVLGHPAGEVVYRPTLARVFPSFGPLLCQGFRPSSARFGQIWPGFDQLWATTTELDPMAKFGPALDNIDPSRSYLSEADRCGPEFGQIWPDSNNSDPDSDDVG